MANLQILAQSWRRLAPTRISKVREKHFGEELGVAEAFNPSWNDLLAGGLDARVTTTLLTAMPV